MRRRRRRLNVLGMRRWSTGPGWSWRAWGELHTARRTVAVDDVRGRAAGNEGRRDALSVPVELVPEHVDLPAHVLVCLLQVVDKVDRFEETRRISTTTRKRGFDDAPLLRISHLLAFMPRSAGS